MITAFLGTPAIAVPALRLLAQRTQVQVVITQPDRPAGRGQQLTPPPVKLAAQELGLALWQPETTKGGAAAERLRAVDVAIVLAYGELLRQDVLDAPRFGCINLHGSLLPRWRGASPLQAALRAGDAETGVTVMRMVRGLDAGPMHLHERIPLPADATLPWLHEAMAEAAARALDRFLAAWPPAPPLPQDETLVTHCRKLTDADGHLDFTQGTAAVERWVRAYVPAPGCWAWMEDASDARERLKIHAAAPRPDAVPAGVVVVVDGELRVGCGDGALALTRVQSAGRPALPARAWLNGRMAPARLC